MSTFCGWPSAACVVAFVFVVISVCVSVLGFWGFPYRRRPAERMSTRGGGHQLLASVALLFGCVCGDTCLISCLIGNWTSTVTRFLIRIVFDVIIKQPFWLDAFLPPVRTCDASPRTRDFAGTAMEVQGVFR